MICLRTCAEALIAKASGLFDARWHSICELNKCKVDCLANLNTHLQLYTQELSRVFFKRDNLKNRRPWWLSAFYSFCIQSYVRRVLIELANYTECVGNVITDISTTNKESTSQDSREDGATTEDAPRKLQAAYSLFYDDFTADRYNSDIFSNIPAVAQVAESKWLNEAATIWKELAPDLREQYLRKAISSGLQFCNFISSTSGHPKYPLKRPRTKFDHLFERYKLNADIVTELVHGISGEVKANQYLYLPVRLFTSLSGLGAIRSPLF